jgi:hypothetical protein
MSGRRQPTHQGRQEEKMGRSKRAASALAVAAVLIGSMAPPAWAQYNSGSSGVHGVFPPGPLPATTRYLLWNLRTGLVRYCSLYDTALRPDTCQTEVGTAQIPGIPGGGLTTGVFEFTSFDAAVSPAVGNLDVFPVGYDAPTPLTILVQTQFRVRNNVVLHLEGANGESVSGLFSNGQSARGGRPGPGGFAGGEGGKQGTPSTNGNSGFGPTGGPGGFANNQGTGISGGTATASPVSTSLTPLAGGSGGGGGGAYDTQCGFRGAGGGGGGGGGAVLVAASGQILHEGVILVYGGIGGFGCQSFSIGQFRTGGSGSGGSIRFAAPTISGGGSISVGNGIVRLEGNTSAYTGAIDTIRGTILGAPQPAVPAAAPALRITSVGGIAVGATPSGSVSTPDVTFATAPTAPVAIELAASNIPTGTLVNVRANPVIGSATAAASSALSGSNESSTASASLTIPTGAGVITAVTSFPVTTAMLDRLPAIPGLRPTAIEVTAEANGASRTFVIGADARRVELTMGADGRFAVLP